MWEPVIAQLKTQGVQFTDALSEAELGAVEKRFSFHFPPDLRAFLATAMPIGKGWPDWRAGSEADLRAWLRAPLEGILFDLKSGGFWLPEWGGRPATLEEAERVVTRLVEDAPRLIPVYMHRMMPDEPRQEGNPVFSVHQADIICYGADLADYLREEFKLAPGGERPTEVRSIRFWDIERFQSVRWEKPSWVFDNRVGQLPTSAPELVKLLNVQLREPKLLGVAISKEDLGHFLTTLGSAMGAYFADKPLPPGQELAIRGLLLPGGRFQCQLGSRPDLAETHEQALATLLSRLPAPTASAQVEFQVEFSARGGLPPPEPLSWWQRLRGRI